MPDAGPNTSPRKLRVVCAEDSADLAELYAEIINGEDDMACVASIERADDLAGACEAHGADIAVVDLTMPGRRPLDAIEELNERPAAPRVIVFSARDDQSVIDDSVRAGAWGFVSKNAAPDVLIRAIRSVAEGRMGVFR